MDHLVEQVYVLGIVSGEYSASVLLLQKVVWRNKAIGVEVEDEHWVSKSVHYSGSWLIDLLNSQKSRNSQKGRRGAAARVWALSVRAWRPKFEERTQKSMINRFESLYRVW